MNKYPVLMMKIIFAVAIVGAGIVGLTTVAVPKIASQYIFANTTNVDTYLRILGAWWMALGCCAALGFFFPLKFSPVLLIQLLYKSIWLLLVAVPLLVKGNLDCYVCPYYSLYGL